MIIKSVNTELKQVAHNLLKLAKDHKIFLLEGPVGAGKTTLIKYLCHALKTVDVVNSPTFALINEYQTIYQEPIYHFDCYRIEHIDQAIELDFESYFNSGYYCFIEWPSNIRAILPLHCFSINITIQTPVVRTLTCKTQGTVIA